MTTDTAPLSLSESAARRVAVLLEQEDGDGVMLRVSVSGGGCSGFQYAFSLDSDVKDDELVVERNGVSMVVDQISLMYIAGSEVDFIENIGGSYFVINNPNATSMCGCGNSFGIAI
ncbi:MAG: iron-sulfur cluster insertion protein ErpA [Pseudomonadota bacterium]|nr:iron-sulfur cluster insertion protein ErpA [Pseudomonadota bacterium]